MSRFDFRRRAALPSRWARVALPVVLIAAFWLSANFAGAADWNARPSIARLVDANWPLSADDPWRQPSGPARFVADARPLPLGAPAARGEFSLLPVPRAERSRGVRLTAYQAGEEAAGEDPPAAGDPPADGAAGESEEPTFGEAPPETRNLFLRRQAVLLQPGQHQFDVGLTYTLIDQDFPVLLNTTPIQTTEARLRRRLIQTPLAIRYGWSQRVQLFANTSFGWLNNQVGFPGVSQTTNSGGIGDTSFGASFQARQRRASSPAVIFTLTGRAPTGNASSPLAVGGPLTGRLGLGFWGIGGNFLTIHNLDPVVLFWGGGAQYLFGRDFGGTHVQPGIFANYNLGVGFSVNERITLSTALLGTYITDYEINGQRLPASAQELIRMRFAATISNPKSKTIIEPFAHIGATDDAPAMQLGVILTYY
jgi:hypothetical protein